jgi:adenylylsulfate kinase
MLVDDGFMTEIETETRLPDAKEVARLDCGAVVWFTGLSGAGKSTVAGLVYRELQQRDYRTEILDADIVRKSLTRDLGFSRAEREENIRRIGFVAELLSRHGVIVLVAAITPYRTMREELRNRIRRFIEVYIDAPLEVCERRDPKGLYRKARAGELTQFTGIDDPYEAPLRPEVHCCTAYETVEESVAKTMAYVEQTHLTRAGSPADRDRNGKPYH